MATEPVPSIDPVADLAACVAAGTLVVQAHRTDVAPQDHPSEPGMATSHGVSRFCRALKFAMSRLLAATGC